MIVGSTSSSASPTFSFLLGRPSSSLISSPPLFHPTFLSPSTFFANSQYLQFIFRLNAARNRSLSNTSNQELIAQIGAHQLKEILYYVLNQLSKFEKLTPDSSQTFQIQIRGFYTRQVTIIRDINGVFHCILNAPPHSPNTFLGSKNPLLCDGHYKKEGTSGAWQLDTNPEGPLWQAVYILTPEPEHGKSLKNQELFLYNQRKDKLNIIHREIQTSQTLNSPYLLSCLCGPEQLINPSTSKIFVFSKLGQCDLFELISIHWKKNPPTRAEKDQVIMDVIKAVHYVHTQGYIHNDLCAQNYIYFQNKRTKLGDLEKSRKVGNEIDLGNPDYLSPEYCQYALNQQRSVTRFKDNMGYWLSRQQSITDLTSLSKNTKGDLWSLGVLIYTIENSMLPWVKEYPEILGGSDKLIAGLLQFNPSDRIEANEAIKLHRAACKNRGTFPLEDSFPIPQVYPQLGGEYSCNRNVYKTHDSCVKAEPTTPKSATKGIDLEYQQQRSLDLKRALEVQQKLAYLKKQNESKIESEKAQILTQPLIFSRMKNLPIISPFPPSKVDAATSTKYKTRIVL